MGYLASRIVRLLPLVLIACAFSLVLGYWGMLPDDLENLSVSIIASNLMSENILSAITTKNYWDVVNDYKPLMHLWYVGLLLEFYIVYPLIESILNKVFARTKKNCIVEWGG